jgi:hypothetical protein
MVSERAAEDHSVKKCESKVSKKVANEKNITKNCKETDTDLKKEEPVEAKLSTPLSMYRVLLI